MIEYFKQQFTIIKQIFTNLWIIPLLLISYKKNQAHDESLSILLNLDIYAGRCNFLAPVNAK